MKYKLVPNNGSQSMKQKPQNRDQSTARKPVLNANVTEDQLNSI